MLQKLVKALRKLLIYFGLAKRSNIEEAEYLRLSWALGHSTLYKFKGFTGTQRRHVIDILRHSRIYFSEAEQFNDPFDISPIIRLGGDPKDPKFIQEMQAAEQTIIESRGLSESEVEKLRKSGGGNILELSDETTEMIRKGIRGSSRFLCLTAEQRHPLQWSHYADHHRGVCLHFNCVGGKPFGLAREILYKSDRRPILLPLCRQSPDTIVERMALVKADFWKYEKEFRILATDGAAWGAELKDNFLYFDPKLLVGVTFGLRMPQYKRKRLIQISASLRPDLPIWEAVEDQNKFWLNIRRIN